MSKTLCPNPNCFSGFIYVSKYDTCNSCFGTGAVSGKGVITDIINAFDRVNCVLCKGVGLCWQSVKTKCPYCVDGYQYK